MSGFLSNLYTQKKVQSAIDKKKEEKAQTSVSSSNSSQTSQPKGWGPFIGNILVALLALIIFIFMSLGIIMSVQINNPKYSIPYFFQDFSNSVNTSCFCFFDKIMKSMFNIEIGLDAFFLSIKRWLSTSYYKTVETDINTYLDINKYIGEFFEPIYSNPGGALAIGSILTSVLSFIYIMSGPAIHLLSSNLAFIINYLGPIYYNFTNFEILFNNGIIYFFINLWILFSMLLINLFLGGIGGSIAALFTGLSMLFSPYMSDFKLPGGVFDENSNFKRYALPVFKRSMEAFVILYMIYVAATSSSYVSNGVTIGLWVGTAFVTLSLILHKLWNSS